MKYFLIVLPGCLVSFCFSGGQPERAASKQVEVVSDSLLPYLDTSGKTMEPRFPVPAGFVRLRADSTSFAAYLRRMPLHPHGYPVHLYDGSLKSWQAAHIAVLQVDVGAGDLQQCADAVIRLRAEYLYQQKRFGDIHFNFTNGFKAEYTRWRNGERIRVSGNRSWWVPGGAASGSYAGFRRYLDQVFMYAGTASLERELKPVPLSNIQPGDVWIQGGHPGHAVLVMDVAVQPETGERLFLLAQSFMPAQEIHVLKNPANSDANPWYSNARPGEQLATPEWTFLKSQLRRME